MNVEIKSRGIVHDLSRQSRRHDYVSASERSDAVGKQNRYIGVYTGVDPDGSIYRSPAFVNMRQDYDLALRKVGEKSVKPSPGGGDIVSRIAGQIECDGNGSAGELIRVYDRWNLSRRQQRCCQDDVFSSGYRSQHAHDGGRRNDGEQDR